MYLASILLDLLLQHLIRLQHVLVSVTVLLTATTPRTHSTIPKLSIALAIIKLTSPPPTWLATETTMSLNLDLRN